MPKTTKRNSEQIIENVGFGNLVEFVRADDIYELRDFKYLPEFTLEKLNMESCSDDELYSALKNSTPKKQLQFFQEYLPRFEKRFYSLFRTSDIYDGKVGMKQLYFDSIVFLLEHQMDLFLGREDQWLGTSRRLSFQEKIQILNQYGDRCSYKHMKSILKKLYDFHYERNRVVEEIKKNELPNYVLDDSRELLSHEELMTYIKPIIERKEKKITLNDIFEELFKNNIKLEKFKKIIAHYDPIMKQKLIDREEYDSLILTSFLLNVRDAVEKLKYFLSQYQNILFSKSYIDYGFPFYFSYFVQTLEERKDILLDYPILTLKLIRHPRIRKTIMNHINEQLPICKYYLKRYGDFSEILESLKDQAYDRSLNVWRYLESNIRKANPAKDEVQDVTTIFSNSYIQLLTYLSKNEDPDLFELGYQLLLKDAKKYINVKDDEEYYKRIMKLYYRRCIKGFPLSQLLYFNNEIELCIHQQFNLEMLHTDSYDVKHLLAINPKEYLQLLKLYYEHKFVPMIERSHPHYHLNMLRNTSHLILNGLMVFPFDKLKQILQACKFNERIVEMLFDSIDLSKIKITKEGKIDYNQKFIHLLFGNENKFLENLNSDHILVQNFALIFNYWEQIIKSYATSDISLSMVLLFVENQLFENIHLEPEYLDLKPYITYIGNSELAISNVKNYYLDMKERFYATIPQVMGDYQGYHYEMLSTSDPFALAVGKLTHCCFRIDGAAQTSLIYNMLHPDNRIFCVWKDHVLVAQSWVWRNGNTICFDNIECITKDRVDSEVWFGCYEEATKQIYEASYQKESKKHRIKLITLGIHPLDKKINKLSHYPHLLQDDQKILCKNKMADWLSRIYTDAKDEQVILYQEPEFLIQDNQENNREIYLDQRKEVERISKIKKDFFLLEKIKNHITSINALIGKTTPLDSIIDGVVGQDWYYYLNQDHQAYSGIFSYDPRAYQEYEKCLKKVKESD